MVRCGIQFGWITIAVALGVAMFLIFNVSPIRRRQLSVVSGSRTLRLKDQLATTEAARLEAKKAQDEASNTKTIATLEVTIAQEEETIEQLKVTIAQLTSTKAQLTAKLSQIAAKEAN
mmetsp:Transcript_24365/g.56757  ORF Transcript_24365/g.56757 Transcript_24365/m.56757 type:complete len:118 (+) Transcript_24365:87-440(+)